MPRFDNRVALLDLRPDNFLNTLVQLGGYCTIGQAKRLGLANSDTRALAHLRVFEQNGFLRKVSSYPGCLPDDEISYPTAGKRSEGQAFARRPDRSQSFAGSRLLLRRRGFCHHTEMGTVNWWKTIRAALAFTICGTRSHHSSCGRRPIRRPCRLCCGIRTCERPCNCTHIA